jgi:hypothetical protein
MELRGGGRWRALTNEGATRCGWRRNEARRGNPRLAATDTFYTTRQSKNGGGGPIMGASRGGGGPGGWRPLRCAAGGGGSNEF